MSAFAIGIAGGEPKFVFEMMPDEIAMILKADEVAIAINDVPDNRVRINPAGTALENVPVMFEELIAARWIEALAFRNSKQEGTCPTPLGDVQIDADSQRKISGATLAALIAKGVGQPFSISWTMVDNSVVPHDADQMIAMGMTVTMYLAACQIAGTAIRDALLATHTEADLMAVDIKAGYPN